MNSCPKNRGRSKSFRCFRPVAIDADDDDGSVKSNRKDVPGDQVFNCFPLGEKHSTMVIPKLPDDGDLSRRCRNEKSRRSFSRVLKAVLFETSLAKKIRKRRSGRENSRSPDLSTKSSEIATSVKERNLHKDESAEVRDKWLIDPNLSSSGYSTSSSLCCSCASSITSNSRSSSERKRSFRVNSIEAKNVHGQSTLTTSKNKVVVYYGSHTGLCLLLICLLVLIFWGKVCAIFCTSTWLLFCSGRSQRVDPPEKGVDWPDVDSKKYKKRVVMEGLLERNRL